MKKGLIIGKGWLGSRIEKQLCNNFSFTTTKRISDDANCIAINFDDAVEPNAEINSYDCIIITIPFGKRHGIEELNQRFNNLIKYLAHYKNQLFLISSTGIYPAIEQEIKEDTLSDSELLSPYIDIEKTMRKNFPQVNILRLGGLMGDDRYLGKYLKPNTTHLDHVVNQIHFQDVIEIINLLIHKNSTSQIYNLTTPLHPTKEEILAHQQGIAIQSEKIAKGKLILSDKITNELDYKFIKPNPIHFQD